MTEAERKDTVGELVEAAPAVPAGLPAPAVEEQGSVALMRMIENALINPDFDVEKMDRLLAVKERWDAVEAKKAFRAAKVAFRAEVPKITKNKHVGFDSNKGGARTDYTHSSLDHIEATVSPILTKHGLDYEWETEQADGGVITVTCVLTHVLGHSKSDTMKGAPDQSGNKNSVQAVGSTKTYLQRYTLTGVLGLSTGDDDTDGVGPVDMISAEQKETLVALMLEVEANAPKFLKYLGVAGLDELPAASFDSAIGALEAKRKAQ